MSHMPWPVESAANQVDRYSVQDQVNRHNVQDQVNRYSVQDQVNRQDRVNGHSVKLGRHLRQLMKLKHRQKVQSQVSFATVCWMINCSLDADRAAEIHIAIQGHGK